MKLTLKQGVVPALGLTLAIGAGGCGKNTPTVSSFVTNVSLKTYQQTNDDWVSITASLSTGNFTLAGINLPIEDPRNPSKVYGQISVAPKLCANNCNGGDLTVALDLTQAAQIPGASPLLPNGTALPVGGLQNATVIDIPIPNSGARIYFALGQGVALIGSAVTFSAFDSLGKYVPGVDLFQPLTFGPVSVEAGLFAGSAPSTSGIGLFVDLSGVVNPANLLHPPVGVSSLMAASEIKNQHAVPSQVRFYEVKPSAKSQYKFYDKLYQMSHQKLELKID